MKAKTLTKIYVTALCISLGAIILSFSLLQAYQLEFGERDVDGKLIHVWEYPNYLCIIGAVVGTPLFVVPIFLFNPKKERKEKHKDG